MMINYNDPKILLESLTEITENIITQQHLERLTDKQRRFLIVLINKWKYGETVDGKKPEDIMKDILKIKPLLGKAEVYLKIKYK